MAPKRPAPADEQPPPAVSSDEEEEASSESFGSEEEEEDESSGSDEPKGTQQKAPPPKPSAAPTKPQKPAPPSESESESDSESDQPKGKPAASDSESDSDITPVAAAKPLESQGTPQSKNLKRPRSETTAASEDAAKTPSKKPSAASRNGGEESSRKPSFQRVWSDEDEVTLLEGMIEFWEKKGLHPSANVNQLHEFIRERLRLDFVPGQLANKIRNCRKKFMNRSKKGNDPNYAKPSEQRAYELSKKLWGPEEGIIRQKSAPKANGTASKKKKTAEIVHLSPPRKVEDEMAVEMFDPQPRDTIPVSLCESELSRFATGRVDDSYIRGGLNLVSGSKREELENQWKKQNLAELQVLSERARLLHELTSSIVSAYKDSEE